MQKNIPKGLLMISLTFLFTLTIAGAAFAATGDEVTNAIVTPNTLPFVNSNSTNGGGDQFVVSTTPAQGFPTNGSSYANINTGNDAESSAKFTLNLTIPQGAKTLSFDWMYATNEGSQAYFNDWARADITDGTSTQNILYADTYSNLVLAQGLGYYYATPTQKAIIDVSPYAGRSIRLDFSVYDAWDTDVTSALFIDNLHIVPEADVSVVNDVDDNTPAIGQMIKYTIRAYNNLNSLNTATGVTVIDALPDGVTFDHASSADYDSANDVWNVGTLLPGEMKILYIWATVNAHPTSTSYTNTAIISGNEHDWNLTNNNESETIYSPVANITLANEFRNSDNWDGGSITTAHYLSNVWAIVKAHNNGPDTATNVTIQDMLPAGLTNTDNWYSVSYDGGLTWTNGPDGSYNFGTGNWTINSIASGAECWLAIWTKVTTTGDKINQAAVTQLDQYYTTLGTASATLQVPSEADVAVNKTWENTSGSPITNANYLDTVVSHIIVTNSGPDNANSVVLTDHLPAGFQLNAAQSYVRYGQLDSSRWNLTDCTDWSYDQATGLFTWNITKHLGDAMYSGLANACEVWLYFTNTAHNNTQVLNTAEVDPQSSGQYDPNTSNNVATSFYTANAAANVGITKEFRTDYQNSTSTTTTANYHTLIWAMVHVTNEGPDAVDGLHVTDILPEGLTYLNEYFVSHDGGLTWTTADIYNATTGVWNIGSMLNGADYWIAVLTQVEGHNTTITNVANKTQLTSDWNATNDDANATLIVPAAADVYVNTSTSKNNPYVGEKVVVRVKAGNNGPDTAQNVIVTYKVPEGMEFVSLAWEAGYPAPAYDPTTRTVTWNLGNLTVIDPWMDITLRAVSAGATSGDASVTSDTYDPVSGNNLESGAISVEQTQVNAATVDSTVPMQKTGVPIGMIVTALLLLVTGFVMPRRK